MRLFELTYTDEYYEQVRRHTDFDTSLETYINRAITSLDMLAIDLSASVSGRLR